MKLFTFLKYLLLHFYLWTRKKFTKPQTIGWVHIRRSGTNSRNSYSKVRRKAQKNYPNALITVIWGPYVSRKNNTSYQIEGYQVPKFLR